VRHGNIDRYSQTQIKTELQKFEDALVCAAANNANRKMILNLGIAKSITKEIDDFVRWGKFDEGEVDRIEERFSDIIETLTQLNHTLFPEGSCEGVNSSRLNQTNCATDQATAEKKNSSYVLSNPVKSKEKNQYKAPVQWGDIILIPVFIGVFALLFYYAPILALLESILVQTIIALAIFASVVLPLGFYFGSSKGIVKTIFLALVEISLAVFLLSMYQNLNHKELTLQKLFTSSTQAIHQTYDFFKNFVFSKGSV